jgi:hypothetical protein
MNALIGPHKVAQDGARKNQTHWKDQTHAHLQNISTIVLRFLSMLHISVLYRSFGWMAARNGQHLKEQTTGVFGSDERRTLEFISHLD